MYISATMIAAPAPSAQRRARRNRRGQPRRAANATARARAARSDSHDQRNAARQIVSDGVRRCPGLSLLRAFRSGRSRSRSPCPARYYSRRSASPRCSAGRWLRRAATKARSVRDSTSAKRQLPCPRKSRRARAVGQQRAGAGHEHQARLVEARRRRLRTRRRPRCEAHARPRRSETASSATAATTP